MTAYILLPLLFVTGYGAEALEHSQDLGPVRVLAKPFTPQRLVEHVRVALELPICIEFRTRLTIAACAPSNALRES